MSMATLLLFGIDQHLNLFWGTRKKTHKSVLFFNHHYTLIVVLAKAYRGKGTTCPSADDGNVNIYVDG